MEVKSDAVKNNIASEPGLIRGIVFTWETSEIEQFLTVWLKQKLIQA